MKLALAIAGVAALVAPAVQAQRASTPKFDVASVRPCGADNAGKGDAKGDGLGSSPGRLHLACATVLNLIQGAYGNFASDRFDPFASVSISGGPAWIDSGRYQIDARAESPQSQGTMNGSMLRALLEDRFKLKIHREPREIPVYALTLAEGGPKLQPFKEGSCIAVDFSDPDHSPLPKLTPGQPFPLVCGMGRLSDSGYDLPGATMAAFCRDISSRLDRPVIDKTRLGGMFNIHLDLSVTDLSSTASDPGSIFDVVRTAVRKLGLKLGSAKRTGEFLVIDHVEKPNAN